MSHQHEDWKRVKELEELSEKVENSSNILDEAIQKERGRCAAVILSELEHGKQAGIPETSSAMKILYRILAAVQNG